MAKKRLIIDYSARTDTRLDQKADEVLQGMTANTHFPTPTPPLTEVEAARDDYREALTQAASGGKVAVEIKKQKRAALVGLLRTLAQYVQLNSKDDEAIMLSSGFSVSRTASTGPLPKPQNFRTKVAGKGNIEVSLKKVVGARTYQYEYRKTGTETWQTLLYSKSKVLLTDLESGIEYEFRVLPIGTSLVREYSNIIKSYVL